MTFLLPQAYNWFIHYRILSLIFAWLCLAVHLLFSSLSKEARSKILSIILSFLIAAATVAAFVLPTRYTAYITFISVCLCILVMAYQLIRMLVLCIKKKRMTAENTLIFTGMLILFIAALIENRFGTTIPFFTRIGLTSFAMLAFVFIAKAASDVSIMKLELQLKEGYTLINQLALQDKTRKEVLSNISHEMRTPLAVMSGYAQTALMKLKRSDAELDPKVARNLEYISSEAFRLGDLADKLL